MNQDGSKPIQTCIICIYCALRLLKLCEAGDRRTCGKSVFSCSRDEIPWSIEEMAFVFPSVAHCLLSSSWDSISFPRAMLHAHLFLLPWDSRPSLRVTARDVFIILQCHMKWNVPPKLLKTLLVRTSKLSTTATEVLSSDLIFLNTQKGKMLFPTWFLEEGKWRRRYQSVLLCNQR